MSVPHFPRQVKRHPPHREGQLFSGDRTCLGLCEHSRYEFPDRGRNVWRGPQGSLMARALRHLVQMLVHRSPRYCERYPRQEWVRDRPRPQIEPPIAVLSRKGKGGEEGNGRKFNRKRTVPVSRP
jgi:hypothetical protein